MRSARVVLVSAAAGALVSLGFAAVAVAGTGLAGLALVAGALGTAVAAQLSKVA
jgi:hypothetical protein